MVVGHEGGVKVSVKVKVGCQSSPAKITKRKQNGAMTSFNTTKGIIMVADPWLRTANFVPFQKYNFAAENITIILRLSGK